MVVDLAPLEAVEVVPPELAGTGFAIYPMSWVWKLLHRTPLPAGKGERFVADGDREIQLLRETVAQFLGANQQLRGGQEEIKRSRDNWRLACVVVSTALAVGLAGTVWVFSHA